MRDQVTSIGQSRWLLKLGVPAEKASMAWAQCSGEWHLSVLPHYTASKEYIDSGISIPAFTVADLLEMLPQKIRDDRGNVCALCINMPRRLCWFSGKSVAGLLVAQPLVDLLVAAVEWVLSNGYKLNV